MSPSRPRRAQSCRGVTPCSVGCVGELASQPMDERSDFRNRSNPLSRSRPVDEVAPEFSVLGVSRQSDSGRVQKTRPQTPCPPRRRRRSVTPGPSGTSSDQVIGADTSFLGGCPGGLPLLRSTRWPGHCRTEVVEHPGVDSVPGMCARETSIACSLRLCCLEVEAVMGVGPVQEVSTGHGARGSGVRPGVGTTKCFINQDSLGLLAAKGKNGSRETRGAHGRDAVTVNISKDDQG
ncbi:hypothetical protein VTO42DRAFT_3142 [Malbranchea cinnamomea]